jgi:hypothetical protein
MSYALAGIEDRLDELEREAVFEYLTRNPGARAGEIAAGLRAAQATVSAHLYRGNGRLFANQGGRWFPIPASDPATAA